VSGFCGEYPRTLDSKNRVQLPAIWKKGLPEDLMLVPFTAHDEFHSIRVFPKEGFATFLEAIFASDGGFQFGDQDHNDLRAAFTMDARQAPLDSAGRIIIPVELQELVGLDKDVVAAGEWDYLSLWSPEMHRRYKEQAKAKAKAAFRSTRSAQPPQPAQATQPPQAL
jgi:division/cell wall cluster transcriptional repressor MraZ